MPHPPIMALVREHHSSELVLIRRGILTNQKIARILTKHEMGVREGLPETHYTGVRLFAETISREEFLLAARLITEVFENDGDSSGAHRTARGDARPGTASAARGGAALCAACGTLLLARGPTREGAADHPGTPGAGPLARQLEAEAASVTSAAARRRAWAEEVRGGVTETRRLGAISRARAELKVAHRFIAYAREAKRLEHALAVAHRELELLRKGRA